MILQFIASLCFTLTPSPSCVCEERLTLGHTVSLLKLQMDTDLLSGDGEPSLVTVTVQT